MDILSSSSSSRDSEFSMNASKLIHYVIREAFEAAKINNYTKEIAEFDRPAAWETWGVGLAIISLCSYTAPLAFLLLPCFSKSIYDRIMTFLIALGIGALSGSTMFIMIPQAFHITELDNFDSYHTKSAIIITALYGFFTVDRLLQYILELRRTRQMTEETRVSVDSDMQTSSNDPSMQGSIPRIKIDLKGKLDPETIEKEKADLAEELDFALTTNALARTFSTRRRVAVLHAVDQVEYRDHENVETSGQNDAGEFLDAVNEGFKRSSSMRRSSRPEEPPVEFHKSRKKSANDEMSVEIRVVEKKVIEPGTIEIASVAYMIIFGSSANNFVDGMSAAFSDSMLRGLSIGIAVISQQLPQELGVLAILVNSGLGLKKTLLFNFIPIILSYAGFTAGVFLDNLDESYDQYIFAISSGMYFYIFLGTLIPELRDATNELIKENMRESLIVTALQYCGFAFGVVFMFFMSLRDDNNEL
ncbi:hypothetical protein WR25_08003 [Diploscapter pachys]|uniref:Uncharacterized protein n=1 Tax=Diploscapter pachys TaxID=2018661 RepID=A0A2A2JPU7_9BILA|nr:hypothetical protein WR25_08003 [Diploscapter pachys]